MALGFRFWNVWPLGVKKGVAELRVWAVMMHSGTVNMDVTSFLTSLVSAFSNLAVQQRADQLT